MFEVILFWVFDGWVLLMMIMNMMVCMAFDEPGDSMNLYVIELDDTGS